MAPPAHPQTVQFLSTVLSQRGPNSLPYSEDVKWLIRQHLLSLSEAFPSLQPRAAAFTHNDGRSVNLLQADGTVPTPFHGVTYNIPVVVWLLEPYPRHAPLVFVNPTRDMVIKRPHPHVSPSGLVTVPYLSSWVYPSSNLVDLARSLALQFSRDPPLYSQRRAAPPGPGAGLSPSPSMVPPPRTPQRPVPPMGTEDPNDVFRRNAVSKLVDAVHGDVAALRKAREAEMDALFNAQGVLRRREEDVNRGLKELQDEKEALEQQLQMVLMNTDVLEGWVQENEEKVGRAGSADNVDEVFEPCDALSRQMLEASTADLAIEDVVYSLDKAVQEGVVPFDQYLRSVRLLSREQFFHRAMAAKVRAAQMQAHVASMAARSSSQYAM